MADQNEAPARQYLTFVLGAEMYGIDIRGIKEIIEYGGLTTVPMMPGFIRGVINLRGAVVPVVDLSVRFGREPTVLGRRTCIVIIEVAADSGLQDIGVVVDAVSEVVEIAEQAIEQAPAFGACVRSEFIEGMALMQGRFTVLLDVRQVFAVADLASLVEAANIGQDVREAA